MRKIFILTIAILLSSQAYCQNSTSYNKLIETLNNKVPEFMKKKKVPGMAMAVFNEGKEIFKQGYGLSNIGIHEKVTSKTGFNIGSISKLFTAVGIMILVEEGKIDLDAPAETYLTRWQLPKTKYDNQKVTIRGLLNHTAGISVHGYPGFIVQKQLPSLEASLDGENGPVRANEKVEIIIEPNTKFQYSGGGYTILQLIIEEVSQMPFHKFMKKKVFRPLKMRNTSFNLSPKLLNKSAIPYDDNEKRLPFEYFTAQGAAGLHITLNDFILFANEILNKHSILSSQSIDLMTTPTKVSKGNYGLGFSILKFGPLTFKGHSGSNTGWQSAFFIDFKNKSGLIMMTNGDEGKNVLINTLKTWASWKYKR